MGIEAINVKGKSSHYFKKLKHIKHFFPLTWKMEKFKTCLLCSLMDMKLTGGVTFLWLLECKHSQAMADV